MPVAAPVPILGVGGDIKNSFCLLANSDALMSQYIGTLENIATQDHFRGSLEKWIAMSGIRPRVVAHDLHPQSFGREVAARLGLRPWACSTIMRTSPRAWLKTAIEAPVIGIAL